MMRPNLANKNPRLPGASLQKPKTAKKVPSHLENHKRHPNEFEYLLSKNAKDHEFYRKDSAETKIMTIKIQVVLYDYALNYDRLLAFVCWTSYITVFVAAATLVCKYVGKQAIGSGIPQLKVIMNGFVLQNYLSMRTLVAKVIGLILTLGSGLPVGKEGPFVHIGAIVGFRLSKMTQNFQGNKLISSESREFQNLLSGCAVGIACTFTAPVGAVLYAIECTHKYFAVKHYWKSFFATTCAALVFRYANVYLTPPHIGETILAYYETHFPNEVFVAEELPVFILLG
uniref:Chloride channel protein n=1 Tax=Panagrolaimus sp. ES5 TaxID=591445 RepID=A0AC34GTD3_9BILA